MTEQVEPTIETMSSTVKSSKVDVSSTFAPNLGEAVHRWFRYSAGYSASWVGQVVHEYSQSIGRPPNVLDPFVGSGTTLIACQEFGSRSVGIESHSFVSRVARAKLHWNSDVDEFIARANSVATESKTIDRSGPDSALLQKCFGESTLSELFGLREAIESSGRGDHFDDLLWLALVAIVRKCSHVGTAQWQYVLPNKTKSRVLAPYAAWDAQVQMMAADMRHLQSRLTSNPVSAEVLESDARSCDGVLDDWADLVITSPPYANNYDYADATRLEMTFLGEVSGWSDLKAIRENLVHSCSQHMTGFDLDLALNDPLLAPIINELRQAVVQLSMVKESKGGKKAYDKMATAYFLDLAKVWISLRSKCRAGSRVCFVVGDSAPYGVHLPVERWLGELACAAGFRNWHFEKTRDRNVKWKNRKHQVPLQEGRLWVDA